MKKVLAIVFFVFNLFSIGAQNYGGGNGSILSEETLNDCKIVRRKHVQTVKMSENCDVPKDYKSLWKDYSLLDKSDSILKQEYGEFPLIDDCSGKTINIMEIVKITSENNENPYLFYVEVEGQTGYMRGINDECDIYEEGKWSIVGQIESSGKKWTIRKVRNTTFFQIKERLYVRDKPGVNGTKKIYLFYKDEKLPEEYQDGKTINVKKVTDEKEIIDGREGRWLNIEYENIEGWVFEGYVYETFFWGYFEPEAIIDMFFKYGQP